ncbi:putative competence protein ComEC [Gordonia hirsuta DSM 44140 = NBRC 16056]|uniref:Putative competence protein ComEC n=1 Tax=Gordonia hirsuta DSM 44140 = NBRC 16056 TaxID=1121927 RepID=L7L7T0_9ACTN|nr:ComEC/Rec2 family competence protein [Gordonia hirsuta]GAC57215.1 putative competence protein ComEC [Gordonia hirsuta DSM 44140 = NBRC 16056]
MTDLRLAGPALACWGTIAAALCLPLTVTWILTACWTVGALGAWLLIRVRPATVAAAGVLGLCGIAAASAIICAIRIAGAEQAPVRELAGTPELTLRVSGDPVVFARQGGARLPVQVLEADGWRQRTVNASLMLRSSQMFDAVPGQQIAVRVRVRPPPSTLGDRLLAARLTAVEEPTVIAPAPVWQRWAGAVRTRLQLTAARALPPRAAGLFPGLILGDTTRLEPELRENFRAASLTHLVAVSGANFSLVCGAVVLGLRLAGASTRVTVALGLASMVGFVILVRPTDSVLRAAVMGGVGLLGALAARRAQALPALGAAIIVVLLFWPQMALAPGFALSVVATLGLVLWAAPLRQAMTRRGMPEPLAVLLAMTLAAQILTTPLVIAVSGQLSLVAVPANLLAAPVIGVIALLGTGAAVIGALGPPGGPGALAAEWLIRATGPEMWWLLTVADRLGGPRWSAPEVPGWQAAVVVTLLGVFGVAAWRARRRPRRASASRDTD